MKYIAILTVLFAATLVADEPVCDNCTVTHGKHYTLKVDAKGIIETGKGGELVLIETKRPIQPSAPIARTTTRTEIDVTEDCKTKRKTGTNRRSCRSDGTTITLPKGYVFVKLSLRVDPLIRRGSENDDYIDWSNYVTVVPGLTAPRTISVSVHARSGKSYGESGRTKTRFRCDYVKLP